MSDWWLKFGFGGVQEFISQARKGRDLAAGSRLVSEVARSLADCALEQGAKIHLPAGNPFSFPHQIVVTLKGMSEGQVEEFGKTLEDRVKSDWQDIAINSLNQLPRTCRERLEDWAVREIQDVPFEFYWVAGPYLDEDPGGSYIDMASAFDDRKHTRTFQQLRDFGKLPPWACSVCGVRTSVLQPPGQRWVGNGLFVSTRERLCQVCAVKRSWAFRKLETLPSTHAVARDRFFRDRRFGKLNEALSSTLETADGSKRERMLMEVLEALDDLLDHENQIIESESLAEVPDTVLNLLCDKDHAARVRDVSQLAYYCVAVFDGDQMGKWLGGEFWNTSVRNDRDRWTGAQQGLSERLSQFTLEVDATCSRHRAHLIYAGGDDAMLFAPMDLLFALMKDLSTLWQSHLEPVQKLAAEGRFPTFSFHASIVHAKQPLQPVVADLHGLLEEAKERGDRDAISILAWPRSGEPIRWMGKWHEFPDLISGVEAFSNWRMGDTDSPSKDERAIRKRAEISRTLISTLLQQMPDFFTPRPGGGQTLGVTLAEAFDAEVERFYARSGSTDDSRERWDDFRAWLLRRSRSGDILPLLGDRIDGISGWEAFVTTLSLVAFLARHHAWSEEA